MSVILIWGGGETCEPYVTWEGPLRKTAQGIFFVSRCRVPREMCWWLCPNCAEQLPNCTMFVSPNCKCQIQMQPFISAPLKVKFDLCDLFIYYFVYFWLRILTSRNRVKSSLIQVREGQWCCGTSAPTVPVHSWSNVDPMSAILKWSPIMEERCNTNFKFVLHGKKQHIIAFNTNLVTWENRNSVLGIAFQSSTTSSYQLLAKKSDVSLLGWDPQGAILEEVHSRA